MSGTELIIGSLIFLIFITFTIFAIALYLSSRKKDFIFKQQNETKNSGKNSGNSGNGGGSTPSGGGGK